MYLLILEQICICAIIIICDIKQYLFFFLFFSFLTTRTMEHSGPKTVDSMSVSCGSTNRQKVLMSPSRRAEEADVEATLSRNTSTTDLILKSFHSARQAVTTGKVDCVAFERIVHGGSEGTPSTANKTGDLIPKRKDGSRLYQC